MDNRRCLHFLQLDRNESVQAPKAAATSAEWNVHGPVNIRERQPDKKSLKWQKPEVYRMCALLTWLGFTFGNFSWSPALKWMNKLVKFILNLVKKEELTYKTKKRKEKEKSENKASQKWTFCIREEDEAPVCPVLPHLHSEPVYQHHPPPSTCVRHTHTYSLDQHVLFKLCVMYDRWTRIRSGFIRHRQYLLETADLVNVRPFCQFLSDIYQFLHMFDVISFGISPWYSWNFRIWLTGVANVAARGWTGLALLENGSPGETFGKECAVVTRWINS